MSSCLSINNETTILCVNTCHTSYLQVTNFNKLIGETNKFISQFCDDWRYPAVTIKPTAYKGLNERISNLNKVMGVIYIYHEYENLDLPMIPNNIPFIKISIDAFKKSGFVRMFFDKDKEHTLSVIFAQKIIQMIVNSRNLFTYMNTNKQLVRFDLTAPVDDEYIIVNADKHDDKQIFFPNYVLPSWFGLGTSPYTKLTSSSVNQPFMYSQGSYKYVINPVSAKGDYEYNSVEGKSSMSEYRLGLLIKM
jgi:hypothetical protein